MYSVHRVAYFLHYKEDPGALQVCHKCDTPYCINPHHLFLGTSQDNMDDMIKKGRKPTGEKNWNAKLTNEMAKEIRSLYNTGNVALTDIVDQFGISLTSVKRVVDNKVYYDPEYVKLDPHQNGRYANSLTWELVREIRRRYSGVRGQQALLAKEYSIGCVTLHNIVHLKIWKEG